MQFEWRECELWEGTNYLGEADQNGWVPSKYLLEQSAEFQKQVHNFVHMEEYNEDEN